MNKKERNIEKGKIIIKDDLKWLKYGQYLNVMMVVLFLIYFSFLLMQANGDIVTLFHDNLFVTVGFIVAACGLFITNQLKKIRSQLLEYQYVDTNYLKLIFLGIAELVLFNFAVLIIIIISLVKYFKWGGFNQIFYGIRHYKQGWSVFLMILILFIFIFLTYLILFTALAL